MSLLEPGVKAFEQLNNIILEEGRVDRQKIEDVFSRKYIETNVQELLGQLVAKGAEKGQEPSQLDVDLIREVWNEWLTGFEMPSDAADYYTVIGNLVVEAPMQVGTVTLSPLTEQTQEALLGECSRIIQASPDSEEAREQLKQSIARAFQVEPRRVIAQATVSGLEPRRGREIFQIRVSEVLHALRFFGYFIYPASHRTVVDLAGYVGSGDNVFLRLVAGRQGNLAVQRARDPRAYRLTGERLRHLENIGLALVGDILSKQADERSSLENSCINAITWISRGLHDDVADSRFLKLCIAMESLLVRRRDIPYSRVMAERVAFLLGRDGQGRENTARQVTKIYDVRSRIAHEGRSSELQEQLGPAELYSTHTVLHFVRLMSQEGWTSPDDFVNWCDKLRFTLQEPWSGLAWAEELVASVHELLHYLEALKKDRFPDAARLVRERTVARLVRLWDSADIEATKLDKVGDDQLSGFLMELTEEAHRLGLGDPRVTSEQLAQSASGEDLDRVRTILDRMAARILAQKHGG